MKIEVRIVGRGVVLVPYRPHHVEKYHGWMQDEELQQLTASEPLSLDEEYKMQQSWQEDQDKATFIILDKALLDVSASEVEAMVGDVNLFLNDQDSKQVAETEIMVAEASARRKGFGREAMLLMMQYGIETLNITRFTAKISMDNNPSLALFHKSFGFQEVSRSDVFQEVTLETGEIPHLQQLAQEYCPTQMPYQSPQL
eukprot:m.65019 g.65019  ORF g.65019 m.65019 type:complete len:199 (-) comp12041_c0_seq1:51-647(-)